MALFNNYLNNVDSFLKSKNTSESKMFSSDNFLNATGSGNILSKAESETAPVKIEDSKVITNIDRSALVKYFGKNKDSFLKPTIGIHPDFETLQHDQVEYHFTVSMFVDIKGSTKLALKYPLEKIRQFKDSILTACIYIANHFGGHIQRLQGDGIFIHFVRKGQYKNDAIINSLNAGSLICQFISTDMAKVFNSNDIDPLKVRVGIDYGDNDKVMWSYYGIPGCSELTTTSLHTDLAAKLQAKAKPNTIMFGANIKKELDLPDEFYYQVKKYNGEIDYYIIQGASLNYNMFSFNWQKYLKTYDFYDNKDGSLEIDEKRIRLKCYVTDDAGNIEYEYKQNSYSIPKGKHLQFHLLENDHRYIRKHFETIEWTIENRGSEAKAKEEDLVSNDEKNQIIYNTESKYLGHHYMVCRIKRPHSDNLKLRFPVFVQ